MGNPRSSKTTVVNPSRTPWPTRTVTHLNYADEIDLSLTSGVLAVYSFHANGLYDPDSTGTGHQPLGFDQYAANYNRYRVWGVSYKVMFANIYATAGSARCAVKFVNGSNVPSRPAIFEVANGTDGQVGPYGSPVYESGYFDLTKLNSDPAKYLIDDRYSALVTSNPTEAMFLHVAVYPNATATLRFSIMLRYHVEFYDIETPGSSMGKDLGHTVEYYREQQRLARRKST